MRDLLGYQADPEMPSARIRLYFDDANDDLVAVIAFRDDTEGSPERGFFIFLVAISIEHQRLGVGFDIVTGILNFWATERPGSRVTWMVDPSNLASIAFCESLGCEEPSSLPEYDGMLEYYLDLPSTGETPADGPQ